MDCVDGEGQGGFMELEAFELHKELGGPGSKPQSDGLERFSSSP